MDDVLTAEIEYRLDAPCTVPLKGLPLIARGHYIEVSPMTVALRLMEDHSDGMKEIGHILSAEQIEDSEKIEIFDRGSIFKIPGRSQGATMLITARLETHVVEEDWQGIRPDVPLKDFKGVMVHMQKTWH